MTPNAQLELRAWMLFTVARCGHVADDREYGVRWDRPRTIACLDHIYDQMCVADTRPVALAERRN